MNNDLISRSARLEEISKFTIIPDDLYGMGIMSGVDAVKKKIENAPAVDAVSRAVFEQVQWERDVAIEQLKDHGIPFGGIAPDVVKVVRCRECVHWYECEEVCLKIYSDGAVSPYAWQTRRPDDFCSYGERKNYDSM